MSNRSISSSDALIIVASYLKKHPQKSFYNLIAISKAASCELEALKIALTSLEATGFFNILDNDLIINDKKGLVSIAETVSNNQNKSGTFQKVGTLSGESKTENRTVISHIDANTRSYPADRKKSTFTRTENNRPRTRPKNNPDLIKDHGNRCGHQVGVNEVFEVPKTKNNKSRPPVSNEAIRRMHTYSGAGSKEFLPRLNGARYNDIRAKKKRRYKKNGEQVKQRSCRTEVCYKLVCILICFLDLKTMRVGKPKKDSGKQTGVMEGVSMKDLAEMMGVTVSRAEEAMKDLVLAGYIKVFQQYEETNGIYVGLAAIRTLSGALFKDMGLGKMLSNNRQFATNLFKNAQQSNLTQDLMDKLSLAKQIQMDFISETTNESYHTQALAELRTSLNK